MISSSWGVKVGLAGLITNKLVLVSWCVKAVLVQVVTVLLHGGVRFVLWVAGDRNAAPVAAVRGVSG